MTNNPAPGKVMYVTDPKELAAIANGVEIEIATMVRKVPDGLRVALADAHQVKETQEC